MEPLSEGNTTAPNSDKISRDVWRRSTYCAANQASPGDQPSESGLRVARAEKPLALRRSGVYVRRAQTD